jgi:hypothetical protein
LARERALAAARRRGDVVHRLPPGELRGGRLRNNARTWLLSGAIVESGPGAGSGRIIDAAAAAAGLVEPVTSVRRSAAGGALVFGRRIGDERVLLRVAGAGWPGEPRQGYDALRALGERELVPRALDAGEVAGATWTLETALLGERPQRLDQSIAGAVSRFSASLPRSQHAPSSVDRDLASVGSVLVSRADRLHAAAERTSALANDIEAIARHGDLWLGNLLAQNGSLSGVVDWDGWDADGVPGADVLHLFGTDRALESGRELGEVWLERPWSSGDFRSFSATYWSALGVEPADGLLRLAGIAWWASAVAGTLARAPHRADDERWVAANVDRVLERIPQL